MVPRSCMVRVRASAARLDALGNGRLSLEPHLVGVVYAREPRSVLEYGVAKDAEAIPVKMCAERPEEHLRNDIGTTDILSQIARQDCCIRRRVLRVADSTAVEFTSDGVEACAHPRVTGQDRAEAREPLLVDHLCEDQASFRFVAEVYRESRLQQRPMHAAIHEYAQHASEGPWVGDVIRHRPGKPPPEPHERHDHADPDQPCHASESSPAPTGRATVAKAPIGQPRDPVA